MGITDNVDISLLSDNSVRELRDTCHLVFTEYVPTSATALLHSMLATATWLQVILL